MINLLLFFDDKNLKSHLKSMEGEFTLVTPSPMHADMSRLSFDSQQGFDVITISNFIKTYTEELFEKSFVDKLKRKSELNLILGSLWRILNQESSFELFKKSFNLLTDFRAFSLNEDVLSSILENYDPEIANSVLWFHRTLMSLDIVDEHRSYFLIAERLREGDLPILFENERNIIFTGFDFLTPAQIDMLQALSIRNNIYLPFSKEVFDKSKDLDWIKWIAKFDTNVVEIDQKLDDKKNIQITSFSKNYLSKLLKSLELKDDAKLIMCSKTVDQQMIGEVPYNNLKFKTNIELLAKEVSSIEEALNELTMNKALSALDFSSWCDSEYKSSIEEQDFKKLKSLALLVDIFEQWKSLSDKNITISNFEVRLFIESLKLNTPRNAIISSSAGGLELEGLSSLDKINDETQNFFCATSSYSPIKSSVVDYSEDVQKYLASIGPIRRSEFEFEILKFKLRQKLQMNSSQLLIEKNLLKEDAGWAAILKGMDTSVTSFAADTQKESGFKYFTEKNIDHSITHYSASRLQSFMDCPQKYWLNYILKQSKRISFEHELSPMELGLIEHAVIEKYLKEHKSYDEKAHKDLIIKELEATKSIKQENLKKKYLIEILSYTGQVIQDLITLSNEQNINLEFEKDLKNSINKAIGSIDCYAKGSSCNVLLDFKRGAASIPSQVGLFDLDKIQLWFYLNQMKVMNPDFMKKSFLWGYVNLGEPEKSLIFTNDPNLKESLEDSQTETFKKIVLLKEDLDEKLELYSELEGQLVSSINSEKKFNAKPKSEIVCKYCDLKNICTR